MPISPVTGRLDAFEWKTPFDQLAGPIEEGNVSEGEKALASLPPVARTEAPARPEPEFETAKPKIVQPEARVIDAEPQAKAIEPETPPAKPAKPVKPVVIASGDATPATQEQAVVEPFFGRPPDDPGVKDPALAAPEAKTRLKLF